VNALHFFDENTGIACFDRGIRRTTNSGLSWVVVGIAKHGQGRYVFPNSQTGYCAGGSIHFTKQPIQGCPG
jgi:hypothetical protein